MGSTVTHIYRCAHRPGPAGSRLATVGIGRIGPTIWPVPYWNHGVSTSAALTAMPYPLQPKILIVRLQQLTEGIWAALMLVLSTLLGATLSADLLNYGTADLFDGTL